MSSKIYNYLSGIQTKGKYARREDKEKALSYAEKAKALQEEKEYWLDEIEDSLRMQYSGNKVTYPRLSLKETYLHYKFGGGRPLYVDISGMHISSISAKRDFNNEIGKISLIQTLELKNLNMVGVTVGQLKFKYLGNLLVEAAGNDYYNFEWHRNGSIQRNIITLFAGILHKIPIPLKNEIEEYVFPIGQPYDLHLVGKAKINP